MPKFTIIQTIEVNIMSKITEKEKMVLLDIYQNPGKSHIGYWAENLIDLFGWDKSRRYYEKVYRLPAHNFIKRLEKKGLVKRIMDVNSFRFKWLGYRLTNLGIERVQGLLKS